MITKEDVEEVFSQHPALKVPDEVFLLEAPLVGQMNKKAVILKGARPMGTDIAFLSKQATRETVVHETLHTLGFGEFVADKGAKLMRRFREILPTFLKRKVKYEVEEIPVTDLERFSMKYVNGQTHKVKKLVRRR